MGALAVVRVLAHDNDRDLVEIARVERGKHLCRGREDCLFLQDLRGVKLAELLEVRLAEFVLQSRPPFLRHRQRGVHHSADPPPGRSGRACVLGLSLERQRPVSLDPLKLLLRQSAVALALAFPLGRRLMLRAAAGGRPNGICGRCSVRSRRVAQAGPLCCRGSVLAAGGLEEGPDRHLARGRRGGG